MNDGITTEVSIETGTDNNISVSGNDVEPAPETIPQEETTIEEETKTETEETTVDENTKTVSGNDISPSADSDTLSDDTTVSGNDSFTVTYVPYDDSGLINQVVTLTAEVSELNNSVNELHTTVAGVSGLLLMLFGFTVFKWCEQKIKRFTKGIFNKYE